MVATSSKKKGSLVLIHSHQKCKKTFNEQSFYYCDTSHNFCLYEVRCVFVKLSSVISDVVKSVIQYISVRDFLQTTKKN